MRNRRKRRIMFRWVVSMVVTIGIIIAGADLGIFPENEITTEIRAMVAANYPPELVAPINEYLVALDVATLIPPIPASQSDPSEMLTPTESLPASTLIPIATASARPTETGTATSAPSTTPTSIPSETPTEISANTATVSLPTMTETSPPTATATNTLLTLFTSTPSLTPKPTKADSPTSTPLPTHTASPTHTPLTPTPTNTLLPTATLTPIPANNPPIANNDIAITLQNNAITIFVLANDTDPDGDPLTITNITQGSNGNVSTNGSSVTYSPSFGFTGSDSFTYTIDDGNGGTDTGSVSISVTP